MKTKAYYLKMIDGDPVVQYISDGHIINAVYNYDLHYLEPADLEIMTRAICKSWVESVNDMGFMAKMAGL